MPIICKCLMKYWQSFKKFLIIGTSLHIFMCIYSKLCISYISVMHYPPNKFRIYGSSEKFGHQDNHNRRRSAPRAKNFQISGLTLHMKNLLFFLLGWGLPPQLSWSEANYFGIPDRSKIFCQVTTLKGCIIYKFSNAMITRLTILTVKSL